MPKHKTKGPLTFQGAPLTLKLAPDGSIRLLVTAQRGGSLGQPAEVRLYAADDAEADSGGSEGGQQVLLQLAPHSDCIITARWAHGDGHAPPKESPAQPPARL